MFGKEELVGMKVRCFCGTDVDVKKMEYDKPFRTACPQCKRSYLTTVELVAEKTKFWEP